MALSWKENYATIIKAKTWDESVEGYKITNVLGLAFNYYLAYTKFITGFDVTLDFGIKCEFFFADTYKVGWANETAFGKSKGTELEDLGLRIYNRLQSLVTAREEVIENRITLIEEDAAEIERRSNVVGIDDLGGGTSAEVWLTNKTITTPILTVECAVTATINSGGTFLTVSPAGVAVLGPLIEFG